jgi:hypothetical protein
MDETGIDLQVISHAPFGFQRVEASVSAELAIRVNDCLSAIVKRNPTLISERMEQALGQSPAPAENSNDEHAVIVAAIKKRWCRKRDAQAFDIDQDAAIRGSLKGVEELKGNVHVSFNRADEPRGNDPGRNRGRISCDAESF